MYLLLPLLYTAIFFVFLGLSAVTDTTNHSGAVFSAIVFSLMLFFPLSLSGYGAASVVYQIKALCNQELKVKNCTMMVVAVLYMIGAVLFTHRLWLGMMSV